MKRFFIPSSEKTEKINDLVTSKVETIETLVETFKLGECNPKHACTISNVLRDVEMFSSFDDSSDTLFNTLCPPQTLKGSRHFLKYIIENPIKDISTLNKRVSILKSLEKNIPEDLLKICSDTEEILPWIFCKKETEDIQAMYEMVYFNNVFTRPLNTVPKVLTSFNMYKVLASPIISIFSPLVYFIIPYLILVFKLKLKIGFIPYVKNMLRGLLSPNPLIPLKVSSIQYISLLLSVLFYFQGVFNSVEISKATYTVSKYIVDNMNKVTTFITTATDVCKAHWKQEYDQTFFNKDGCSTEDAKCIQHKPFSLVSNFGEALKDYKCFDKDTQIIETLYKLDALYSICRLRKSGNWSYPEYDATKGTVPKLDIKQVWHPYIKSPVKNDITFDKSIIITGPNAGGKSTLVKSILLNILLCQTLCISNSSHTHLTPFSYIASQINVPDCKGKESLFEAEMFRAKHTLDRLKSEKDGYSMIFMDEIFNSTNPIEGISGAYAVAKRMASYKHALVMFTTHYIYLTKLSKEYPDCFKNMKMNIVMKKDKIHFPYKLVKGVSKQWIALELLKHNGFDKSLVDDAIEIKCGLFQK
jgi:hypothetical protein